MQTLIKTHFFNNGKNLDFQMTQKENLWIRNFSSCFLKIDPKNKKNNLNF